MITVDPYFNGVILLLKCNGANNSTSFPDSSLYPKTVVRAGNTKVSTLESAFNGSSAYFDGTGDYLRYSGETDFAFGTDDFTIEMWINTPDSTSSIQFLYDGFPSGGAITYAPALWIEGGFLCFNNQGWSTPLLQGTTTISVDTWHHVAVSRSGTTVKIFLDGVEEDSATDSADYINHSLRPVIGTDGSNVFARLYTGYLAEIRVTGKDYYTGTGYSRYSASFTPPPDTFTEYGPLIAGELQIDVISIAPFVNRIKPVTGVISITGLQPDQSNYRGSATGQGFTTTPELYGAAVLTGSMFRAQISSVRGLLEGRSFRTRNLSHKNLIMQPKYPCILMGRALNSTTELYGGASLIGDSFSTSSEIIVTTKNESSLLGRSFKTLPEIVSYGSTNTVLAGRSFSQAPLLYGAAALTGRKFTSSLIANSTSPTSSYLTGYGFSCESILTAIKITSTSLVGRGFTSSLDYCQMNGNGFKTNPILVAIKDVNLNSAFVMNVNTGDVSRYTNYPFMNIVTIGDNHYGVMQNGLYLLSGDKDINTNVNGTIITKDSDHGAFQSKRIEYVYLDSDSTTTITPIVDGITKTAHQSSFGGRKTKMALGNSGRYWQFKIQNINVLQGMEILPQERQRRVK